MLLAYGLSNVYHLPHFLLTRLYWRNLTLKRGALPDKTACHCKFQVFRQSFVFKFLK